MPIDEQWYEDREQTLVKHAILRSYIEQFAHIIGFHWNTINYIDCFSGPWESRSEDLEDTSFSIAIEELRKARKTHLEIRGKRLRLRCLFIEKDAQSYSKLQEFARGVSDIEIHAIHGSLEDSIDEIKKFVGSQPNSFSFYFIDPTGWSGFALHLIREFLTIKPSETVITFMSTHIKRFVEFSEQANRTSFIDLYGSAQALDNVVRLTNLMPREDACVQVYCEELAKICEYPFVGRAIVLHKDSEKTHFHLVYGSRNATGMEVFKKSERKAMKVMEDVRAKAFKRKRESGGQSEFGFEHLEQNSSYYENLRHRYSRQAKSLIESEIVQTKTVSYDALLKIIWRIPLVWETDLREFLHEWSERFEVVGIVGRQDPKRGQNIVVRIRSS